MSEYTPERNQQNVAFAKVFRTTSALTAHMHTHTGILNMFPVGNIFFHVTSCFLQIIDHMPVPFVEKDSGL